MKNLLLIILLFAAKGVMGQDISHVDLSKSAFILESRDSIYYDTIPVIMFGCDTSAYRGAMTSQGFVYPFDRANHEMHQPLTWIKGFVVIKIDGLKKKYASPYLYPLKTIIKYLDDCKIQLPSTSIIIQTIKL